MAATALYAFPSLRHLPLWDARGFAMALLLHAAATEPLFYAMHRAFHSSGGLYAGYHSRHHASRVPTPFTAGAATPLEGVAMGAAVALPLAGACAAGCNSVALAFAYVLAFDNLRAMGHCNVEVFPSSLFQAIPALRYLIYTPTYVTLSPSHIFFVFFQPSFGPAWSSQIATANHAFPFSLESQEEGEISRSMVWRLHSMRTYWMQQ